MYFAPTLLFIHARTYLHFLVQYKKYIRQLQISQMYLPNTAVSGKYSCVVNNSRLVSMVKSDKNGRGGKFIAPVF